MNHRKMGQARTEMPYREDHGYRTRANQIDHHRRILEWFGHWLKG